MDRSGERPTAAAGGRDDLGTGDTREKPIRLGGCLFTLVEPHRGHEVAYNRWYERDHFYAGCMIGAGTLAGARFVATAADKARRFPAGSPLCGGDVRRGSYLALYWILAGRFGRWIRWGTDQVRWLHDHDRMFPHRDHVHTLMYRLAAEWHADPDGVPAELALDHRYPHLVVCIGTLGVGRGPEDVIARVAADRPPADQVLAFRPVPLLDDAPSDVPRDAAADRVLLLAFTHHDPAPVWDDRWRPFVAGLEAAGLCTAQFVGPFRATVPGTDRYADELWEK